MVVDVSPNLSVAEGSLFGIINFLHFGLQGYKEAKETLRDVNRNLFGDFRVVGVTGAVAVFNHIHPTFTVFYQS